MLPGTGPYIVSESDIDKGKMIKVHRRKDYWAEKERRNIGSANFDELQEVTVRDRNLEFEMFKKGDLDLYAPQVGEGENRLERLTLCYVRCQLMLLREK